MLFGWAMQPQQMGEQMPLDHHEWSKVRGWMQGSDAGIGCGDRMLFEGIRCLVSARSPARRLFGCRWATMCGSRWAARAGRRVGGDRRLGIWVSPLPAAPAVQSDWYKERPRCAAPNESALTESSCCRMLRLLRLLRPAGRLVRGPAAPAGRQVPHPATGAPALPALPAFAW